MVACATGASSRAESTNTRRDGAASHYARAGMGSSGRGRVIVLAVIGGGSGSAGACGVGVASGGSGSGNSRGGDHLGVSQRLALRTRAPELAALPGRVVVGGRRAVLLLALALAPQHELQNGSEQEEDAVMISNISITLFFVT